MHLVTMVAILAMSSSARADFLVDGRHGSIERPSTGEVPALRLGVAERVNLERVALTFDGATATLVLALATHDRERRDIALPISLPPGARVRALAISRGGDRTPGVDLPAELARARYQAAVDKIRDPALLEQAAPGQLMLHVFPLAKREPATIELVIDLPGGSFALDPERQTLGTLSIDGRETRNVHAPVVIDRPDPGPADWMTDEPARRGVDTLMSLIAAEQVTASPMPTVVCDFPPALPRSVDLSKGEIRREVRYHRAALGHCYMLAAQRDPSLAGRIDLSFVIAPDGHVVQASTAGTLDDPEVTACVAAEAATSHFHEGDSTVEVNYPITFQIRE